MARTGISTDVSRFRASIPVAIALSREEAVEKVDRRLVQRLFDKALEFCPVRTGRLKAGMGRTPLVETGPHHYSAEVFNSTRYAPDVEFGRHPGRQRTTAEGSPMHAQPFMRNALAIAAAEWDLGVE